MSTRDRHDVALIFWALAFRFRPRESPSHRIASTSQPPARPASPSYSSGSARCPGVPCPVESPGMTFLPGDHPAPAPADVFARAFGLGHTTLFGAGRQRARSHTPSRSFAGEGSSAAPAARTAELGVAAAQAVPAEPRAVGEALEQRPALREDEDSEETEAIEQANWNLINPQTMTYFIAGACRALQLLRALANGYLARA